LLSKLATWEACWSTVNRKYIRPGTGSAQNHIKGRERCIVPQRSNVKDFRAEAAAIGSQTRGASPPAHGGAAMPTPITEQQVPAGYRQAAGAAKVMP
jgi:hypothetical protein